MKNKNFLNPSVLRLRKGTGEKNILFIHDGGGEAIQYMTFCHYIDPEFNVYGIRYPANKEMIAANVKNIEQLAETYIEHLKEELIDNVYLLVGYCIGGKLAYEMARKLNNDPYLVFLNVVPPNQQRETNNFSLEEEKKFLHHRILFLTRSLQSSKTTEQLWRSFVLLLQKSNLAFFIVKSIMPPYMKNIIRKFKIYDNPNDVIYYLNLVRSFEETHYRYFVEENNILSRAFYFNAIKEPVKNYRYWERFFKRITFYNINSNHIHLIESQNAAFIVETIRKELVHDKS